MTDRTIAFEWLAETASGNALSKVTNAICAASDQDTTTWFTNGGKRIAKIAPVDEIPDYLPDRDRMSRIVSRLTADGAAFRREELDSILIQVIGRQVEEIHRSLGLERDDEGDLVQARSEQSEDPVPFSPLSQGKFTPSGPITIQLLVDVLSLIGVTVSMGKMATWTHNQRVDAYDWAIREHLAASDNNDVARVERPAFLPAEGS
jgi:hypothetical protein